MKEAPQGVLAQIKEISFDFSLRLIEGLRQHLRFNRQISNTHGRHHSLESISAKDSKEWIF